jgi:hypothetical protein
VEIFCVMCYDFLVLFRVLFYAFFPVILLLVHNIIVQLYFNYDLTTLRQLQGVTESRVAI